MNSLDTQSNSFQYKFGPWEILLKGRNVNMEDEEEGEEGRVDGTVTLRLHDGVRLHCVSLLVVVAAHGLSPPLQAMHGGQLFVKARDNSRRNV